MNHASEAASATERPPVRRVVIAGGGTAGWMAAAALSRTLGKVLDITLIESEEIGTVGVGEATIPTLVTFHRLLDINEQEVMAATNATMKLGIAFDGWRDVGEDYIHSFGTTGKDHWTAGFQHFWLKGRERGLARDYGEYCLELRAAQENRFAHLPNGGINYAFHLDSGLYARFLRRFSEGYGVRRVEGRIGEVALAANGDIAAVVMADGSRIEGDLFIDCTGFRALLIGQTLGVGFEDWSQWLFNDTAIAVQTESLRPAVPYVRCSARDAGWQWRIPLQHRVGNGIVFSSRHTDEASARATLLGSIEGAQRTEPRVIRFRPGQRVKAWERNCVSLGLASGFLEPLESTSIHLIQRGITRLLQSFPHVINQVDIDEYNAQVQSEIVHIRDFVILHYAVSNRRDTPYWRDCAAMELPPSLRHRIDLFAETGRVFRIPNELFAENSWVQVMLGQGLTPRQRHPAPDLMGDDELNHFLEGIRRHVESTVSRLPTHMDYIRSYCPMKDAAAAAAV
ncbi:tryptophan halogenase family protein [Dyella sp.]|uniref:tryptophan halogenase family protein n=1 Tax=Dyella sp. TaxID=1869338 RepID=UPI002D76B314|nr:tryptophan halogenase family protein [Dyella sp.]HET6431975.1 tryptophan halogenase family protein [Dyella sp.]